MLSQKHTKATKVNYKSGFYITTQEIPDFVNDVDNRAIRSRLRSFKTTALPKKDSSVRGKLESYLSHVFICLFVKLLKVNLPFSKMGHCFRGISPS